MPENIYKDQLESSRITTRFLTENDIPAWTEFVSDPQAIEFFPEVGKFKTHEERGNFWIQKQLTRYKENRYGLQAIISKSNHEFLGMCGLLTQEVDGITELEVGYHFFKKHWGKGYAPEAAKLFMDYAAEKKLSETIISIIDVGNKKSQRVAEKNGLTIDKQTKWSGLDVFIYRKSL